MPLAVLALLTTVFVAQETKWAPVPKANTTALWLTMLAVFVAYGVLRPGRWRPEAHAAEQLALGTISNSYYAPRRDGILQGVTIAGGIIGGLWWTATSWLILVRGIERTSAAHGLINLQICTAVGVLAGGTIGAALGLAAGEWWERAHRRARGRTS